MKSFAVFAAFAASANALVGRNAGACCFHITASGGMSGNLGQLSDGQNRIGDNSLSASQYCINSTGVITDSVGRGCIITSETTQFQCDEGKAGTPGFYVSSSGQLEFHGSPAFIACETGQNGGSNIYTTNSTSVTNCKNIRMSADSCTSTGASAGGSSSGTAPSGQPGSPGQSGSPGQPGSTGSPAGSAPVPISGSPITVVSTVTVSDCSCSGTGVPAAPAAGQSSAPGGAPAPGGTSQPSSSAGGSPPAIVPVAPAPGGPSQPSSAAGGSPPAIVPATSAPGGSSQPSSSAGGSPPAIVPVSPAPAGTSQPSSSAGGSPPASVPTAPASGFSSVGPSGGPAPSGSSQQSGGSQPSGSSRPSAAPSGSPVPSSSSHSSSSAAGFQPSSAPMSSGAPAPSTSTHPSSPSGGGGGGVPISSSSASASRSSSSSGSCPTTLSGDYQYPHLMVPISSSSPDTPEGNSFNGTINSSVSTTFNFDIPQSYSGKTCSLVFLFPKKTDLQTSSYSFSGDGKIAIGKLSQTVSSSTTYNNVPSVSKGLGTITISPGNSYVVSTFSCPAGQAVSYEMKNAGSTNLNFFEDWNPSPLGLFITTC
ncbi:uncharacterized protein N7482_001003 [Penicillium canariense]|uniref:Ubiquitin 3 binding protein But2 C-terminal domain-containing protein n=1 Tax=Penicillium canariense TaxID=189055 RepID=A0A9W9IGC7_9EURO|nr:uncharacterized protein N7482_001003 [Penicillium canariense]KAJ5175126.1 hypothetical protein N7482_001003 [Penicillium canariense]